MTRRLPAIDEMIGALISEPSISSADPRHDQGNLGVIHRLAEWAETLGFRVEIDPVNERKANLIATLGASRSNDIEGGLVLSGHTDTVPCNPELWSSDPFTATERDGRIYGLGSADMKSFLALILEAAAEFRIQDLQRPLVLLGTADEESSMSGARQLLAQNRQLGRQAVIGEPTGLKPIRMHKGVMMESIMVRGQAGHSSNPALGANAIVGMQAVMAEVLAFQQELKDLYRNPAFAVDYPTINLGAIHGGDNPNRICGACELLIDIRPLPGMDINTLHEALCQRLEGTLARDPRLHLEVKRLFEGLPAFETPAENHMTRSCETFSGQPAGAVAFGTEAPFLDQLGMQTIVMGPGFIDQAHQPDEYLPLEHIRPGIDLLSRLIERYCLNPDQ
jgi:acetylornithine deacetylase